MSTTGTSGAVETVVIGSGHAGLAVSRLLTAAGHDHVVLDRGNIGERWRSERWDSLHLLTPNWMTRLPGLAYGGPDPEGYLSAGQLVGVLEQYAASFDAPVVGGTTVLRVEAAAGADPLDPVDGGHTGGGVRYRVVTDGGTLLARNVVVATGPHGTPHLPAGLDEAGRADVEVVTAKEYRNPGRLAPGGVLVVGASSSGVQIADELNRSGRDVVLAVGRHTRMPRRYRGMDVFWWLESTGRLARTIDTMPDASAARREPSLQLIGSNDPQQYNREMHLGALQNRGVRLVGRLEGVSARTAHLGRGLADAVAAADTALNRFLDNVDEYVDRVGLTSEVWPAVRPRPIEVSETPSRLDLRSEGIGTVLVAAGYRPHHPWLRLPVSAPDGSIRQVRGVTPAAGLYVVGQRFQHRRDSGFIHGARHDARAVVGHLLGDTRTARAVERSGEPAA